MIRKLLVRLVSVAVIVTPVAMRAQDTVDVLIRGGSLIDGSGGAARSADVGIRGDRIVFVGDAASRRLMARRTIDARGLTVSPGFIDPHSHTAGDLGHADAKRRQNAGSLMQGVTTVVTGNDGGGPIDVGGQLTRLEELTIGTNVAFFAGFGTIRSRVLGPSSAAPDATQLTRMREFVTTAMDGGALGLSTGLYYAPQSYSMTGEVIALAQEAAARGGIYDSHLRDESSYTIGLLGAISEAIRIGREAGLPVHIAHIKALGVDVWGQSDSAIALIRAARAAGQRVTADQYPYTASGTGLGASLLPRWAEAGGGDSLRQRAADPATRERLLAEMRENLRRRNGAKSLLLTSGRSELRGKTLEEIARVQGVEPVVAALSIILNGGASVASFNMDEKDIRAFMQQEFVFTGSDGSGGHPRKFGAFAKKLREYVLEKRVLTLETMIRHSTSATATALGIADRGLVKEGAFADVIVFDPAQVRDRATYEEPELLAEGMRWVLVNGSFAIDEGKLTDRLAGRGIRRAKR
jgi:N-acyl-D-aspartate/D-glutamate deacylase